MGASLSFIHQHVGDQIVVCVCGGHLGGGEGGVGAPTVTCGGISASMLVWINSTDVGNNVALCAWLNAVDVPEGSVQIIVSLPNATFDYLDVYAFSFQSGVRMGNVASQGSTAADPPQFSLIAQDEGSVTLCALGSDNNASVTEQSSAPVFDPVHVINTSGRVGVWRREGKGTMPFDFAFSAGAFSAACALEVLPR
jgi:hypothetical protein